MSGDRVSVCIVTWNSSESIESCLSAIFRQTCFPDEIVIVDNGSTDDTLARIESTGWPVNVVENRANLGFSRAVNIGLRETSGSVFMTVNPDVRLHPEFVAASLGAISDRPDIGSIAGMLIRDGEGDSDTGAVVDSTGLVLRRNRRAEDRDQGRAFDPGRFRREEVFGACGAAAVFRRSMLEDLAYGGGEVFDESFFCYKEDVDLAWRAQLRGWRCVFDPSAVAVHARGWRSGDREQIPEWIRVHSLKNRYLMLLKNERPGSVLRNLGPILWLEARVLGYILLFEPGLWKVYPAVLKHLSAAWRKRQWTSGRRRELADTACSETPRKKNFLWRGVEIRPISWRG